VTRHQVVHTGEKKHKYEMCGETFTQKSSLITQRLVHSGERQHKCEKYGKTFAEKGQLTSHELCTQDLGE